MMTRGMRNIDPAMLMKPRSLAMILAASLLAVLAVYLFVHRECRPRLLTQSEFKLLTGKADVYEHTNDIWIRTYNGNRRLIIKSITIRVDDLPNTQHRSYRYSTDISPLSVGLDRVSVILEHRKSGEWSWNFVEASACDGP